MTDTKDTQTIKKAVGRPMLEWVGKKPLDKIEFFPAQEKEVYGVKDSKEFNKLFWGDNLQVLAHLLKEYRGKVDLVYIDPPFDSKADYVKKVKIKGEKVNGVQEGLLEEKQYTDIWDNDEYLQFMYERLAIARELLSDKGLIYLHCDWHRSSYLKILMDEVFGQENFINEIIWKRADSHNDASIYSVVDDRILFYGKSKSFTFNTQYTEMTQKVIDAWYNRTDKDGRRYKLQDTTAPGGRGPVYEWKGITRAWRYTYENMLQLDKDGRLYHTKTGYPKKIVYLDESKGVPLNTLWTDVRGVNRTADERSEYPTQKPEKLLERIIKISSNAGDLVLDFFCGSGTTMAVAQKLGRKWIGCDINLGAIQTTTKRLNQIIEDQIKEQQKLVSDKFDGLLAFKVLNVNDYDIFKNEIEAKETVMEIYGVEPIKRSYFDGILDNNFVKVMPMNRVLNKLDIKNVIKSIGDEIDSFTVKPTSKSGEETFEQGVIIVCSGAEIDANDFIKKENKTGVRIEVRDILNDKKNLIFKQKPEAKVEVSVDGKQLSVRLLEFYSPILMRKLELENQKLIDQKAKVVVDDFRQIIDSVAIDVDYNGDLFNAEIMDVPSKKEMTKAEYKYSYSKSGDYVVAVKIVDVLGEEYFETFKVTAK